MFTGVNCVVQQRLASTRLSPLKQRAVMLQVDERQGGGCRQKDGREWSGSRFGRKHAKALWKLESRDFLQQAGISFWGSAAAALKSSKLVPACPVSVTRQIVMIERHFLHCLEFVVHYPFYTLVVSNTYFSSGGKKSFSHLVLVQAHSFEDSVIVTVVLLILYAR